jgi:CDP-diacylglycerol--glycerol-3-phosphate 3-phosphatidyltransferase
MAPPSARPAADTIPWMLIRFRAAAGPALLLGALLGWSGGVLAALLTLPFLSDIFDGIIARRLGASTPALRVADSRTDVFFYVCVLTALCLRHGPELWSIRWPFAGLIGVQAGSWTLDWVKFGKATALHSYTAKAWGITLFAAALAMMAGLDARLFLRIALGVGYVSNVEDIAIKVVLPSWHCDVGSLWHAARIRRRELCGSAEEPSDGFSAG